MRGWGSRDDMLVRAMEFYQTLRKSAGGAAVNYLFLGDINTMGME